MAQWYSEHIYPWIVSLIGRFFGIFPFSVAEFLLYAGILRIIGSLVPDYIPVDKEESR